MGAQLRAVQGESNIEWRNDYFERCDGITKKKMPKAASQPVASQNWRLPRPTGCYQQERVAGNLVYNGVPARVLKRLTKQTGE